MKTIEAVDGVETVETVRLHLRVVQQALVGHVWECARNTLTETHKLLTPEAPCDTIKFVLRRLSDMGWEMAYRGRADIADSLDHAYNLLMPVFKKMQR